MSTTMPKVDLTHLQKTFDAGYQMRKEAGSHPVTLRVTADIVSNTQLHGRIGKFEFESDEPPSRGGEDSAPSPLEYFMAGAAFCFLSQIVQFAPLYQVQLYDARVDLRVHFDDSEKYNLAGPGAAFQQVIYKVKISSPSPEGEIRKLIAHAERGCHASQSLALAIPVSVEAEIETVS